LPEPQKGSVPIMYRISRGVALVASLALLVPSVVGCGSSGGGGTPAANVPGVTSTEVIVGTHQPLTGPAAPGYSKISAATKAYFDYVNANGGVNGRKITYKVLDDGYNPANTQQVVRQLVQQDKVFAILNGLGTPTHTGVLDFLNTNKVPDLFVASGSHSWNQPTKYPYTFGYQTDYIIEGKILGDYVKKNYAGMKVCYFGQNDDFGADGLAGLEKTLGTGVVVEKQNYVPTNTNVAPQIGALMAKGCQVVVSFTVPGFTALSLGTAARIGFKAQWVVSSVGSDFRTLAGLLKAAGTPLLEGLVSASYLPAVDDTANPWVALFQKVNKDFNGDAPFDGNVLYGFSVGYLFVQTLKAAGKDLTRESLLAAVEKGGYTGPGLVPLRFSKTDHSGYSGVQLGKISGGKQLPFGPVLTTDDGDGQIQEYTTKQPDPPANGIPS
jgi:ABC-type branched-subunit amino acid transport system substrate-binding protein